MKNIEKYPNTKDALEAYELRDKGMFTTFHQWCDSEYEVPKPVGLLKAAEAVRDFVSIHPLTNRERHLINKLTDAIDREENRPKTNYERFGTAEEAIQCFRMECRMYGDCDYCPMKNTYNKSDSLGRMSCFAEWLYSTEDVFKKGKNDEESK